MLLLSAAIAPSVALMYYFYLRDKYEKEPRRMLFVAFIWGIIIVIPVFIVELTLNIFDIENNISFVAIGYTAFIVAGLVEESFKYIVFRAFIWRNREFNEMYDGIVYCVFIALGFATAENIGYVLSSGIQTAFIRSLTAVPAHALFGVSMGYYVGVARFVKKQKQKKYLVLGLAIPVILHGVYDFILFSQRFYITLLFIPYLLYLWQRGLRNVDELVDASPFKNDNKK